LGGPSPRAWFFRRALWTGHSGRFRPAPPRRGPKTPSRRPEGPPSPPPLHDRPGPTGVFSGPGPAPRSGFSASRGRPPDLNRHARPRRLGGNPRGDQPLGPGAAAVPARKALNRGMANLTWFKRWPRLTALVRGGSLGGAARRAFQLLQTSEGRTPGLKSSPFLDRAAGNRGPGRGGSGMRGPAFTTLSASPGPPT